jgi:flagellar biosynthesis/type III secretory pathway protein FliH
VGSQRNGSPWVPNEEEARRLREDINRALNKDGVTSQVLNTQILEATPFPPPVDLAAEEAADLGFRTGFERGFEEGYRKAVEESYPELSGEGL